jgi:hypothetical protein
MRRKIAVISGATLLAAVNFGLISGIGADRAAAARGATGKAECVQRKADLCFWDQPKFGGKISALVDTEQALTCDDAGRVDRSVWFREAGAKYRGGDWKLYLFPEPGCKGTPRPLARGKDIANIREQSVQLSRGVPKPPKPESSAPSGGCLPCA